MRRPRARLPRAAACSAAALLALLACGDPAPAPDPQDGVAVDPASGLAGWSADEIALLRSLSLASLPELPASPSNRVADAPQAARLGERLFFDAQLSADGRVSCASCHQPERHFTDGLATSRGLGRTGRNAPTVVGAAYAPWQFWDGRRDSLWSQALAPLEAAVEMGSTRLEVARRVATAPEHAEAYRGLFGEAPDFSDPARFPERAGPFGDAAARAAWQRLDPTERRAIDTAFANAGKALAAYERSLVPGPSRFDRFVAALLAGDGPGAESLLDADEQAGLRLFVDAGRTRCLRCHNGPLLTNQSFHDVGTGKLGGVPDLGRLAGIQSLLLDDFNCLGPYSDAAPEDCSALRFLDKREPGRFSGAFKTPGLRGLGRTAPYFHNGGLDTLERVVEHYRDPGPYPGELLPLEIDDAEAAQLAAFLRTL